MGQWNTARIVIRGTHREYWLNGVKVVEYDRDTPKFGALVAASEFHIYPHFGKATTVNLLLHDHGFPVSFRNVKIRSSHLHPPINPVQRARRIPPQTSSVL